MAQQYQIIVSAAYQRISDLLETASTLAGHFGKPRTNWKRLKFVYPDAGAAGIFYFTRDRTTTGYIMKLSAPDETENRISQVDLYNETTTDIYVKSSVNGDILLVELHD